MFLRNHTTWAKRPSQFSGLLSPVRALFVKQPMRALFTALEFIMRTRTKEFVLFVFPYREYCENTRYLMKYFVANPVRQLRPIAIAYDKDLLPALEADFPGQVLYARSLPAFRAFFRATIAVTSRGMLINTFYPFYFVRSRKTLINLWHGIPLKRMGLQTRSAWETKLGPEVQHFDYWIVCSGIERLCIACCYGMHLDRIWVTGMPRNDELAAPALPGLAERPRVILYAPTWRDTAECVELFPFPDLALAELDGELSARDCVMRIRLHPNERHLAEVALRQCSNIHLDEYDDAEGVQRALKAVDVLVTDYSSIYFDYLLLDRPMIFVPYDLDDYDSRRGLFFDYDAVTPGPKVTTQAEFVAAIDDALAVPGRDAARRSAMRAIFHEAQPGLASKELASRIGRLADVAVPLRRQLRFETRELRPHPGAAGETTHPATPRRHDVGELRSSPAQVSP